MPWPLERPQWNMDNTTWLYLVFSQISLYSVRTMILSGGLDLLASQKPSSAGADWGLLSLGTAGTQVCFYRSQWPWTLINFLHAAKSAVQWSSICQEIRSTLCVFSVLCSLPITSAAPSPHLHLLALFLAEVSASSMMQLLFPVMSSLSLIFDDMTYRYIAAWE